MNINPQIVVLLHHFRRFLEAAADAGLDVAPLKGAHMLTSVYPPGEDRPMMDVDFLVREAQFEAVCDLLRQQGFTRVLAPGRPFTERVHYEALFMRQLGDGMSVIMEPHRHLIQRARHPIDHEALWARSTPSELDGAPCRRLAPEALFLHTVIHLLTHRFEAPARAERDLELLVRRGGADLQTVTRRAGRWQCRRAVWLALTMLHARAPDLGALQAARPLRPPAPVRAALAALIRPGHGFRIRGAGMRAGQAVLWPLLLDGARPLLRFGGSFAWLRARDLVETLLEDL